MVSCSQDDTQLTVNEAGCISFATPTITESWSRSAEGKLPLDFSKFRVWAYTESPYKTVLDWNVVNKGATQWALDQNKTWEAGKTYYFNAIYPANDMVANMVMPSADSENHAGTVYFDNMEAQGKVDLLFANSGAVTCKDAANMAPVKLQFKHILSEINFTFDNQMGDGYSISVSGLALYLDWASGKINMNASQPRWERVERVEHWMRPIDCPNTADNGNAVVSDARYMMDQTGKIPVAFAVWVYKNGECLGSFPHLLYLPSVSFVPGMSYNFTAVINQDTYKRTVDGPVNEVGDADPIQFSVETSTTWNTK